MSAFIKLKWCIYSFFLISKPEIVRRSSFQETCLKLKMLIFEGFFCIRGCKKLFLLIVRPFVILLLSFAINSMPKILKPLNCFPDNFLNKELASEGILSRR